MHLMESASLHRQRILDSDFIIIYNYKNGTKVVRVPSNYGHINDLTFQDNILCALAEGSSIVHKFSVTVSSIIYDSSITIPATTAALEIMSDNTWCTAVNQGSGNGIQINWHSNDFDTILGSYRIPFKGIAVFQVICVKVNTLFVALTAPNSLVYYDTEVNY